jgi:hypothetical protein
MSKPCYLLVGCGESRVRRIDPRPMLRRGVYQARPAFDDGELYTLDAEAAFEPDLLADLEDLADSGRWRIRLSRERAEHLVYASLNDPQLADDVFDEIHAYEVLEHLGRQGDIESFFDSFYPFWLALKPDGLLCGTCPSLSSVWLWSDPGHRRAITLGALRFLDRTFYPGPPSSDYRRVSLCDFRLLWVNDDGQTFSFVLQAVKPIRPVPPLTASEPPR